MRRNSLRLAVAIAIALIGVLSVASGVSAATNITGHRVILDAGHGGDDPGTTQCPGLYEKDANLMIAEKLKDRLEEEGATVYMTRTDDSTLSNEDRYTYANTTDAEVLLSIHLNGSTDHSVNGTLGLYSFKSKDKTFATAIHDVLADELGVPDNGVTNFMSGVTMRFNGPASIQESVYLSNTDECENIKNGDRADEIAESLLNGLDSYFGGDTSHDDGPGNSGKRRK